MSKRGQKGSTIIEIIISLFIFGIVLVIYSAASNTLLLNKGTKNQQLAFRIASNQMEILRATAYDSLPAGGSLSDPLLSTLPSGTVVLTVSSYNAKTKELTVTVSWKEVGNSNTRNVALTTLITKGGLGQ